MPLYKNPTFYIALFIIASCGHNKRGNGSFMIPRHVPDKYYLATDPAFSKNQDTVLHKGALFSGFVFGLFPNRDTAFVLGYLNGLQDGVCRKWYPNKQLKEERLYINGRKEGIHKGWWENGNPKFLFAVSNDEYTGIFEEWFNNGQIEQIFHYKNGHEQGSEKVWWPDGKIRANYVVIDGEKFGLFGQKLCINKNLKQELK